MSLKAIHSIYSFSEAPKRESSQNTEDTTLKIVKNIQFGNNFTSIYLFFFFFHLWVSPLPLFLPLPRSGPFHSPSWGHREDKNDALSPECGQWETKEDTPSFCCFVFVLFFPVWLRFNTQYYIPFKCTWWFDSHTAWNNYHNKFSEHPSSYIFFLVMRTLKVCYL